MTPDTDFDQQFHKFVGGRDVELGQAQQLAQKLIQLNDNNLEKAKKKEYQARGSAFSAGVFGVFLPFFLYLIVNNYGFDGDLDTFLEANKWAGFLAVGVFTACWKGMKYLAVERHNPEKGKKK